MILKNPHLLTTLDIWQPKYSAAYTDTNERVVLLAKYKVDHSTPVILIQFTKAKHLQGQRFCVSRAVAMECPVDSNGSIPCYAVRMSQLEQWETPEEITETVKGFGW